MKTSEDKDPPFCSATCTCTWTDENMLQLISYFCFSIFLYQAQPPRGTKEHGAPTLPATCRHFLHGLFASRGPAA